MERCDHRRPGNQPGGARRLAQARPPDRTVKLPWTGHPKAIDTDDCCHFNQAGIGVVAQAISQ
jgi:hypothetical protein